MKRTILGLLAALSFLAPSVAAAQVCPAVAALPDSERRVAYSPSASTGPFSITFAILGDSTDYSNWVEVWLNGVRLTGVTDWQLTIPSGTLATACRPITNASITLTNAATGTLQIVGARRPRRTSQFPENQGVSARNLNQVITDITATERETWDKINDVTGRALIGLPGESITTLPSAANRAGKFLGFDATGLIPTMNSAGAGSGNVVGPSTSVIGHNAVWSNLIGTSIMDGGGGLNAIAYGADPFGVADSSAAWTAMLAALGTNHCGAIYFPTGKYRFNTSKSVTLAGTKCSLTIVGDGQDVSVLYWPNASGGMTVNYADSTSSFHARGLSFTTGTTNGGNAISLVLGTSVANPANTAISDVVNVTVRGDDGYEVTNYWSIGLAISNVSNTQVSNFAAVGPSGIAGTGIIIQGLPASSTYAVVLNVDGSTFNALATGILYSSFVQGVTVNYSNFTAVAQGIAAVVGTTGTLNQLTVANSQFNITVAGIISDATVPILSPIISQNVMFVASGAKGIVMPASNTVITANVIGCLALGGSIGASLTAGAGGIIESNIIGGCSTGINLAAGTSAITTMGNRLFSNTADYTDAGAGNRRIDFVGNFTTAGAASLPAIVQGDVWYGSAAGVISALAKDTNATRALCNTGTSNNPAWCQLPISNGISGLGTGVATFLGTPSSANLAAALTDETGTGVAVFGTNPIFTTTITINTGASNAFKIGNFVLGTTYNVLSLNNDIATTSALGFYGGSAGDPNNLYFNVPSTGLHHFRINNSSIATLSATILNMSATTAATSSTTGAITSGGGIGGAGAIWAGTYVATGAVAVGSLPTCNAGTKAARHFVTDANATFTAGIGAVVAAGGANNVPVTCDGTNWRIGANDNMPARKFA